mgnify:CR=1 FL=1
MKSKKKDVDGKRDVGNLEDIVDRSLSIIFLFLDDVDPMNQPTVLANRIPRVKLTCIIIINYQ